MQQTLIIQTFTKAIKQANLAVRLVLLAVICFCVLGTLASLPALANNTWVYYAFHYLPYGLIALTMPISLYHSFLLLRYRVMQPSILFLILAIGVGLLIVALFRGLVFGADKVFFMAVFLAMIAWLGMPFLFRVNLNKFLKFLTKNTNDDQPSLPDEK
ncbi:hypothetical protein SAMN02745664_11112 [Moraxella cuniculi DSM 21768]|uniref:Uncharacterized protein n=1 Tax=Moraxella cuniculi DSM 21768 TaxID=1122245 RepID=A0A1N7F9H6_9GAMM|nr:hypothetical protein [Moraxella cuniculi]OOS03588.1 hypothetical protein B0189_09500 [Moraxella cuniculi]SIR96926.1 hypothetical protein SAMN02745664_11112 [Moraxella cuniculi DSM 21768]